MSELDIFLVGTGVLSILGALIFVIREIIKRKYPWRF